MNPISEQQKKSVQNVRLTEVERSAMRNNLIQEMTAHPITTILGVRNANDHRHKRGREQLATINLRKHMTIAILIALFLSGSVSYAAEGAVPGDMLYPVKIHVNENVESAFAISPEAEARLEAELALRRIVEAEELHAESKLNEETKADLRLQFNEHTRDMEEHLRELADDEESNLAVEISSDFDETLTDHIDTLKIFGLVHGTTASSSANVGGKGSILPHTSSHGGFRTGELLEAVFEHNDDDDDLMKNQESNEGAEHEGDEHATRTPSSVQDDEDEDGVVINGDANVRLDTNRQLEAGEGKSNILLKGNTGADGGLKIGL